MKKIYLLVVLAFLFGGCAATSGSNSSSTEPANEPASQDDVGQAASNLFGDLAGDQESLNVERAFTFNWCDLQDSPPGITMSNSIAVGTYGCAAAGKTFDADTDCASTGYKSFEFAEAHTMTCGDRQVSITGSGIVKVAISADRQISGEALGTWTANEATANCCITFGDAGMSVICDGDLEAGSEPVTCKMDTDEKESETESH